MQEIKTCFEKEFWRAAFAELKNVRSIVLCALFVALRIAVKSLRIPIVPGTVYVTFDFIVNSLGAMIYGPLLGLLGGAVSDTVGALVFPTGPYFFPYIFVEMTSAFLFGLFFYRAHLSATRVILARFSVSVVCNLLMTPAIMLWQKSLLGEQYAFFSLARVIKNVALLPLESVILVIFLGAISLPLARLGLVASSNSKIKLKATNIAMLAALTVFAAVGVLLYLLYKGKL